MEKETGVGKPGIHLRWGGIATLHRVTLAIGVVVFFFSIISPFLEYTFAPLVQIPERSICKYELWSFKCFCLRIGFQGHSTFEKWFFDYWFYFSEFSGIMLPLFVIQIVTLSTAITCIFTKRRILNVLPAILCPASTTLIIYTFVYLSELKWVWVNYHQGYWLTYLSEVIFIINFILKRKGARNE